MNTPFIDAPFQDALNHAPHHPDFDPQDLERILFSLASFDTNLDQYMVAGSGYDGINFYFRAIEGIYRKAVDAVHTGYYDEDDFERNNQSIDFHLDHIRGTKFPTPEIQAVYDRCGPFIERVREVIQRYSTPAGQLETLDPETRYPFIAQAVEGLDVRTVAVAPSRDRNHAEKLVLWSRKKHEQITITDENEAVGWIRGIR